MLQKVQKYITELNMVSSEDTLLVGVSGGADSVALLLVLFALYKDEKVSLEVVHVEHGIRGEESLADAKFVRDLCSRMKLHCQEVSVNVPEYASEHGLGLEEAARILRYEVFSTLAKERNAKVALAHHMEDNAETILFQMTRGSALAGLCGMQPMRMDENGVTYIRPFLSVHRTEIEDFLKSHGQGFCVDSTNLELDCSRNQIRQKVLPELNEINEQATSHINETADLLSEIKDYISQEAEHKWNLCVEKKQDGLYLYINELEALHPVLQKEIVYRVIAEAAGSKKDISAVHVEAVLELVQNQSGREVHLPYQILARREYENICFWGQKECAKTQDKKQMFVVSKEQLETCEQIGSEICVALGELGETMTIRVFSNEEKCKEFPTNPYTKWLDYDKIKQGFCIRTRQSGDYFISDVFGHHKSLNRYFIDEKIPSSKRDEKWLLAQEDIVFWLVGGRISEHVKITEETKAIVELKYKGGKENEC